jgi:predicted nucleic acid-binding protein
MNGTDNFLIDTNIIIGFLLGNKKINSFLCKLERNKLYVSQITQLEPCSFP